MQLVNSLKDGSFEKCKPSDTGAISSDEWFSHFSSLLGKPSQSPEADREFERFFQQNVDRFATELDQPFVKKD